MIKKILLGFLVLAVTILIVGYAYYRLVIYQPPLISAEDRAAVTLLPLPAKLEIKSGYIDLSKGLQIEWVQKKNSPAEKAVSRFINKMENLIGEEVLRSEGLKLKIDCLSDPRASVPLSDEDESYYLSVNKREITLSAVSPYGIIRGLETLLQLPERRSEEFVIPAVEIEDRPRFRWRGLMLDVSRHWMPKDLILRTLDAMATVKLNVFHWHLSDDQGFRVESRAFPKLHEVGSNGIYYTREDIKEIISFAAERGIRVVPEFDVPGHTKSWQIAYPELSSVGFDLHFGAKKGELFAPALDPTKEEVYDFLDQFIGEMSELFPDEYLHIGGDEVNSKYWDENQEIQSFMLDQNLENGHDLQAYFNARMYTILEKHGKRMIGWEEILHPELRDNIVIQSWKNQKSLFESVQQGATAILSSGYYLDLKLSAGKHYQVDPLILPGAVDIIPDTANWTMYDMTMDFAGNKMESQLVIFDKDPNNIYGFYAFMDDRMVFKNGTVSNNTAEFTINSPMGELSYKGTILDDSISGDLSFGLLKFNSSGSVSGGSGVEGKEMPKIEIMKPLTEEEKNRIIGGEAALWSEVVNAENAESRLWPRAAAIAEKLWSPQELTTEEEDMYRRLRVLSDQLSAQGSQHEAYYEPNLKKIAPIGAFEALKTLVDVSEEVKYYDRLAGVMESGELYLPDLPLDGIADVALPESFAARTFNKTTERFLADSSENDKTEIILLLKKWSNNHELLMPYFDDSEKLKEAILISENFSFVSKVALEKLQLKNSLTDDEKAVLEEKLAFLETGENGFMIAVVPGLRAVIMN